MGRNSYIFILKKRTVSVGQYVGTCLNVTQIEEREFGCQKHQLGRIYFSALFSWRDDLEVSKGEGLVRIRKSLELSGKFH